MKFGKEFKDQMVPEWIAAYMDYSELKCLLKEINRLNLSFLPHRNTQRKVDIENQESESQHKDLTNGKFCIAAELREDEKSFFEKLDNELEKVNSFYKDKVEEAKGEAAALAEQMDALVALRRKVKESDSVASSKATSPSRTSSVEKAQMDFTKEVDMSCENNIKPASSSNNEDPSLKEHGRTPSDVLECVKIQNTSDGPKSSVEKLLLGTTEKECSFSQEELEVEEKLKKAFVEFYQKLRSLNQYSFMNLSAFSKILEKYEKITSRKAMRSYMKVVDNSYIGSSDEVTSLLNKVEATFIKHFSNFKQGDGIKLLRPKRKRENHRVRFLSGFFCGFSIALIIAVALVMQTRKLLDKKDATLYLDSIFPLYKMDSTIQDHETYVELLPLGLLIGLVLICLCPFNIIYRSSRFFLIRSLFHCICAPFYKVIDSTRLEFYICWTTSYVDILNLQVKMVDFFLADQLTSQTQAIRSFVYYICYYGWGKALSPGRKMCHVSDVYVIFYYISAAIPFWIRFLQCMRRLIEEKDMKHGFNGFTYFSMLLSVVFQSTFRLRKKMTWKVWALASSVVAALANICWDIRMDWGLLQRNSRNFLLRDKLLLPHKSAYYIAMILEVLLRFVWLQLVLSFDMRPLRGKATTSTFACLEILRRGIWNVFRLENEHLNNVGEYRAFKSLPLPFITYDEKGGNAYIFGRITVLVT
uniref:Phosphate transporter PHO1 homolog 3-like isoform X5 n=1 Tax=Nicotiana sylvestris TaxID=4096 RepID=A0A1U7YGP7_NICSY|nr:PREDICTED: phosphate transporter PHO1 homolog 3-like isoform X5 [Nicotiana sylvestris]